MKSPRDEEWDQIRKEHADLRLKLAALGIRIRELEQEMSSDGQTATPTAPDPEISIPASSGDDDSSARPSPVIPPPLPPLPAPAEPRTAQAATVSPSPQAPNRPPEPRPPEPVSESMEIQLGRVWLVRLGIVILLTGLVFLGNLAWQEVIVRLGAGGKLAMIYLAGFALTALGRFLLKSRAGMRGYAQVLAGGGVATIYYATYAAHFVEPLRVIASPLAGGALLLALAGGIIWIADRRGWEAIATITTALGFYTAAINPIAGFALFSNLVLSGVAITLFVRRRWQILPFLSLAGCYLGFAFWRFHQTGSLLSLHAETVPAFLTALLFPACYWLVFTVTTFLGRGRHFSGGSREIFLTLNNGAFFGLAAPVFFGSRPDDLWLFTLAFGAVLLALAELAKRTEAASKGFDGSYLTQGLALVSLGLLFKLSGYQAAILFALQSGTLIKIGAHRHRTIFQFFSGCAALAAFGFAASALDRSAPHAVLTAFAVSLVFVGTARLFKSQRDSLAAPLLQLRPSAFVALATILSIAAIFQATDRQATVFALAGLGVLLLLGLRWHRMPELVLSAQVSALAALISWAFAGEISALPPLLAVLGSGLFQMHWWQRQRTYSSPQWLRRFAEGLHALAITVCLLLWSLHRFPDPVQALGIAAAALLLLSYSCLTRSWALCLVAQILSAACAVLFVQVDGVAWPTALASLVFFSLQPVVLDLFLPRSPETLRSTLNGLAHVLGLTATFLGVFFAYQFLPPQAIFLTFACAGFAYFLAFARSRRSEFLVDAAPLVALATVEFLRASLGSPPPHWQNAFGLILPLIAQRICRATGSRADLLPRPFQQLLISGGVLGLWFWLGKIVAANHQGFLLTASWSIFAALVLAAGFLLRDRTYRILGLGILMVSVARIFCLDVWQLDPIFRILSFLVLGIVLLAAGFLYNRFAAALKKLI